MEIRNQFAHNPNAISLRCFEEINKDIYKYLLRHAPGELQKEDIETQLLAAFNELFKITAGNLLAIEIEYGNGLRKQLRQHVNDAVVENLDQIWRQAMDKMKGEQIPVYQFLSLTTDEETLDSFYNYFRIAMHEFGSEVLSKVDIEKKDIFKTKEHFKETLARVRKEKKIVTEE
jgi:hypothetical protein